MSGFGRDRDLTIEEIKEFSDYLTTNKANKLKASEIKRNMLNRAMREDIFTEDQYRQINDEIDDDDKNNEIFHKYWVGITESLLNNLKAERDTDQLAADQLASDQFASAQFAANAVAEQLIKEEEEFKTRGKPKKLGTSKKRGGKSRNKNKNKTKTKRARKSRRRTR